MKKCYIVGAGELGFSPIPDEGDLVIAADGGYDHLISHGVRCDLLIGDLDSIHADACCVEILRHPVRKDETDMFLALREGAERGYTFFELLGGTGGREDHTMANYSLLLWAAKRGYRARLHSATMTAEVVCNGSITLLGDSGKSFSVFAFGSDAKGVSILGASYEAEGVTLDCDFPLGVSNSFTGNEVSVTVSDGAVLVMYER